MTLQGFLVKIQKALVIHTSNWCAADGQCLNSCLVILARLLLVSIDAESGLTLPCSTQCL